MEREEEIRVRKRKKVEKEAIGEGMSIENGRERGEMVCLYTIERWEFWCWEVGGRSFVWEGRMPLGTYCPINFFFLFLFSFDFGVTIFDFHFHISVHLGIKVLNIILFIPPYICFI